MPDEIGLFEAIHNMRAMRRLKPDPVPDELIRKIIAAGLCAPSGGDVQHWRFIVVKDPEIKKQIQLRYKKALDQLLPRIVPLHPRRVKPRRKSTACSMRWSTSPSISMKRRCCSFAV